LGGRERAGAVREFIIDTFSSSADLSYSFALKEKKGINGSSDISSS